MTTTPQVLRVLGIEASCDDTAAALIEVRGVRGEILAQSVLGQADLHADFGGVVPEIAARAHAERIDVAIQNLNQPLHDIDLIAVTTGPGLIGGLNASAAFARALATSTSTPLIGVNHLAGHALTPALTHNITPPYIMLLVSGGHCQFLAVKDWNQFARIGSTIDDSPGEAFDKIAKMLGLGYPGGPIIEAEAKAGNPKAYALPRPLLDRDDCNFSFSGLKTAARRVIDGFLEKGGMTRQERADLCASFQLAVAEIIAEKSARALSYFQSQHPDIEPIFAIAGGVAANAVIREKLEARLAPLGAKLVAPPLHLCTDNAAMIAYAGAIKYSLNQHNADDLLTRPRWPLDTQAEPMFGSGKKGAKA